MSFTGQLNQCFKSAFACTLFALITLIISIPRSFGDDDGHRPLVIALDHAWPPYSFTNSQGRPDGLLIDYWTLLSEKLNRPVRFELVDWDDSLKLVRDERADLHGGLFESENRARYMRFSNDLVPLSTALFLSTRLRTIQDLSEMDSVLVGATRGGFESSFLAEYYPDIEQVYFDNNSALVQAAATGEIDAFVADYPVGLFYLHHFGEPERFFVLQTLYKKQLKVGLSLPNAYLLPEVNKALKAVTPEERTAVIQKWVRAETITPGWVIPLMVGIGIIILLVLVLSYTLVLRRLVAKRTTELTEALVRLDHAHRENEQLLNQLSAKNKSLEAQMGRYPNGH